MKLIAPVLAAAVFITPAAAFADDTKALVTTPAQAHGSKLASICASCGVVSGTHSETRSGKASGLGTVGGAVVGGVVGHQFGNGSGRTALTVLGALGGGVAGNQIEKKVKTVTVWITTVTLKDGSVEDYEQASDPHLAVGDVVRIDNGQLVKHSS